MPLGVKVTVTRRRKGTPKFDVPAMRQAANEVREAIINNVRTSKQWSGAAIKANAPSTNYRKTHRTQKRQKPPKPLIDMERRFLFKKWYKIRMLGRGLKLRGFSIQHLAVLKSGVPLAERMHQMHYIGWFRPPKAIIERIVNRLVLARQRNRKTTTTKVTYKI